MNRIEVMQTLMQCRQTVEEILELTWDIQRAENALPGLKSQLESETKKIGGEVEACLIELHSDGTATAKEHPDISLGTHIGWFVISIMKGLGKTFITYLVLWVLLIGLGIIGLLLPNLVSAISNLIAYWAYPDTIPSQCICTLLILYNVIKGRVNQQRVTHNFLTLRNQTIPTLQAQVTELTDTIERCKKELSILSESDKVNTLSTFVPKRYATLMDLDVLIGLLNDQRADSLKEAMNLYEDMQYKQEMLKKQEEQTHLIAEQSQKQQEHFQKQEAQFKKQEAWQKKNAKQQAAIASNTAKLRKQVRFGNAMGVINTVKHWKD